MFLIHCSITGILCGMSHQLNVIPVERFMVFNTQTS